MSAHTPGPWKYDLKACPEQDDDWHAVNATLDDRDVVVADTLNRDHTIDPDEDRANALLIAAAAEYHAGVEKMLAHEDCGGKEWWEGWRMLKAAHAKANGGTR